MYVFLLAEWLRNWGWAVTRTSQRHAGETWRAGSSRAQDRGSEQPRAGDRSLGPRTGGSGYCFSPGEIGIGVASIFTFVFYGQLMLTLPLQHLGDQPYGQRQPGLRRVIGHIFPGPAAFTSRIHTGPADRWPAS